MPKNKKPPEEKIEDDERYHALIETSPDAIVVFDCDIKVVMANKSALLLFGFERPDDVLGRSVFDFVAPEDRERMVKRIGVLLEAGEATRGVEYALAKSGGERFFAEVSASVVYDPNRNPQSIIAVIRDVTERKHIEAALRESEARFRLLFETSPVAIMMCRDQKVMYANAAHAQMFGYEDARALIGAPVFGIIAPRFQRDAEACIRGLQQNTKAVEVREIMGQKKDGTQFPVLARAAFIELPDGGAVVTFMTDLTESKEHEQKQEHLASFPAMNPNPIVEIDERMMGVTYVNPGAESHFPGIRKAGLSHPALSGAESVMAEMRTEGLSRTSREIAIGGAFYKRDFSYITNGRLLRIYFTDITERKNVEDAILENEEKFRALFNNANDMLFLTEIVFGEGREPGVRLLDVNPYACRKLGYHKDELIAQFPNCLAVPGKSGGIMGGIRGMMAGKLQTMEMEIRAKSGTVVPVDLSMRTFTLKGKTVALSIARDITERKKIEEKANQATVILKTTPTILFRWKADKDWTVEFVSENVRLWGYAPEEFTEGKIGYAQIIDPEDLARVTEDAIGFAGRGQNEFTQEYRITTKTEETRWVLDRTVAIFGQSGAITHYHGVLTDVTEMKLMENVIKKERDFNLSIIENTPAFFVAINPDGSTIMMNDPMLEAVGYSFDEVTTKNYVETFVQPEDRIAMAGIINDMKISDAPALIESGLVGRGGRRITVEWRLKTIFDARGGADYFVGLGTDVTERKAAEALLRQQYDVQSVISFILRLPYEAMPLWEVLNRALYRILSIPWLSAESKGSILLLDKDKKTLVLAAQKGQPEAVQKECSSIQMGSCLCGAAAAAKEIVFESSMDARHAPMCAGESPHGHYCVPVLHAGKLLGVINICTAENYFRTKKNDEFVTTVANALGAMIEHINTEKEKSVLMRERARGELQGILVSALPIFTANVSPEVRGALIKRFAERFEDSVKPGFLLDMKHVLRTDKTALRSEEFALLEREYTEWLSRLVSNLGIKMGASYGASNFSVEFLNCPWEKDACGNAVFCMMCRTIVTRSFMWTGLDSDVDHRSSISDGAESCKFEIQIINDEDEGAG